MNSHSSGSTQPSTNKTSIDSHHHLQPPSRSFHAVINNRPCCSRSSSESQSQSSPITSTNTTTTTNNIFTCSCQHNCQCQCPQCYTCYQSPIQSIIGMTIFHTLFYLIPALCLYWIITMNWIAIMVGVSISVVQNLMIKGKSQRYVGIIMRVFGPSQYVRIDRVYQGQQEEQEKETQRQGQQQEQKQQQEDSKKINQQQQAEGHKLLQKDNQNKNQNKQKQHQQTKTIYCFHPHSVFGYGIIFNTNHPRYPNQPLTNSHIIGSNFVLMVPILGAHLKLWGVTGADAPNFKKLLTQGKTISMLPGGYQQATLTSPKQMRIYIKNRIGFIKYAMKYNYSIRPVLVLNQHKAFWTFDYLLGLRLLLNKLKIPAVIYFSRRWGIYFPSGIKAKTIIGPRLKANKTYNTNATNDQQPTTDQIREMHEKYIKIVLKLYEKYKVENGGCQIKVY